MFMEPFVNGPEKSGRLYKSGLDEAHNNFPIKQEEFADFNFREGLQALGTSRIFLVDDGRLMDQNVSHNAQCI